MWVMNGDCTNVIYPDQAYFGADGTHYCPSWDKSTVPGLQEVVLTPEPTDPGFITTGNAIQMVDGVPTRVWFREPAPPPPPVDWPAVVSARRYYAEISGCSYNGWPVATDRDSQSKISAAYSLARDGYWAPGSGWKFADGVYRILTQEQVIALALTVSAHVQACFANEALLMADPDADIESGWPS